MGILNNEIKVYVDIETEPFVVSYKAQETTDSIFMYCPYIPLIFGGNATFPTSWKEIIEMLADDNADKKALIEQNCVYASWWNDLEPDLWQYAVDNVTYEMLAEIERIERIKDGYKTRYDKKDIEPEDYISLIIPFIEKLSDKDKLYLMMKDGRNKEIFDRNK